MIILDTHIWIWWVDEHPKLSRQNRELIEANQASGLGVSIISCWEIAKLVEKNRLTFECPLEEWLELALDYPGVQLLQLSLPIILESTRLSGFHADPSDQIIVATARVSGLSLLTQDQKILNYLQKNTP
ncbi:type II toxin-antitoxin system VapC family toxin [Laspinema palackyanum]|uniref:type II toxin-antitoxin system VapC family toxin n=1 Tax=Laspinema palackyanum TaxID=3231601 RepID=UPI00345C6620|nr:type II toxin-antitoxin system VapC family toxin [Laspinema sp. D2c]